MHTGPPALATKWRMLSQTAEYALRAVLYLAARGSQRAVGAGEVAGELHVPERYLARVLNTLARAGVLTSARGAQGGYQLAQCAAELSLGAVVAPFDAVGAPPQCLLRDQRCCGADACIAHERWHDVAGNVRSFFQQTTIADLLAERPVAAAACDLRREIHA
jgi:Rrf2 family protein